VLDYHLDPATVIATLAENNMTTMESVLRACPLSFSLQIHNTEFDVFRQVPDDLLVKIKEAINAADNVIIAPSYLIEGVSTIMFIFFIFTEFSLLQRREVIENVLQEKEAEAEKSEETS
jgi:hypothetical protein